MACCGDKRRQIYPDAASSVSPQAESAVSLSRVVDPSYVYFEYVGQRGLTVRGSITGQIYRFASPGVRVAVDRRDAPSVNAIPKLRRADM